MSDSKALKGNLQHRFLGSWKTHHFLSGRTPARALVQPLHCPEKGSNWPAATQLTVTGELRLDPSALVLPTSPSNLRRSYAMGSRVFQFAAPFVGWPLVMVHTGFPEVCRAGLRQHHLHP